MGLTLAQRSYASVAHQASRAQVNLLISLLHRLETMIQAAWLIRMASSRKTLTWESSSLGEQPRSSSALWSLELGSRLPYLRFTWQSLISMVDQRVTQEQL